MFFYRKILSVLEKQLNTKEIIVLTGMRRTGKTTILKHLFDQIESRNKAFFDLDNILDRKIFEEEDYNNIWHNLKPFNITNSERVFLFLDEIQSMPEIVKAIKYLYDHYNVKFFLTGSSSFYLKNLFPESLSGRKIIFELFPLDFEEFLIFKGVQKNFYDDFYEKDKNKNVIQYEKDKKLFDEFLQYGGFPQIALTDSYEQKTFILKDIFNSYFEKDVRGIGDFRQITTMRDLILLLMQRTGSKIDINKLSSQLGTSRVTVTSYISFLEATYFIHLVHPFSRNVDREVSGTKKIYCCDTGIISLAGNISQGSLFENCCFLGLRKFGEIKYYQKRSGQEIDFVLSDKKLAVEAKTTGSVYDLKNLSKQSAQLKINDYFLLTDRFVEDERIIPASEL